MRNWVIFVLLFALVANCGCAGFEQYRDKQNAKRERRSIAEDSFAEINNLWKQGYGFNNPNVDRIKKGLAPQNFDGSLENSENKSYFDELSSDFMSYAVKTAIFWPFEKIAKLHDDRQAKRR